MSSNTGNDLAAVLRQMLSEVAVPVSMETPAVDGVTLPRQVEQVLTTGVSSLVSGGLSSMATQATGGGAASWVSWVNPLIGGLMSLFGGGGGEEAAPAALVPFVMPAKQNYQAAFSEADGGLVMPVDRGADGQVRNVTSNVTVQVEAMDSRSFVDRAPEIAQAVKRALLESQGLSGVMREF